MANLWCAYTTVPATANLWRAYTTVPATITLRTWNQYKNQHTYQLVHFSKSDKYEHINTRHYVSPTPRPDCTINIDFKKNIEFHSPYTSHQPWRRRTPLLAMIVKKVRLTLLSRQSQFMKSQICLTTLWLSYKNPALPTSLPWQCNYTTADNCRQLLHRWPCTADPAPLTLHHWPCTRWPHHPLSIIHWPLHRSAASSPSPPHGVLTHRGYYR